MEGRITFVGCPWEEGFAIDELEFSGDLRLDEGGSPEIVFHLHLGSASYTAERYIEEDEDEPIDESWLSPVVWANYGRATISSTKWRRGGFRVGSAMDKLVVARMRGECVFSVDGIAEGEQHDGSDRPFGIYLLGHDACAAHKIKLTSSSPTPAWDLSWEGRIALVYGGDGAFRHSFKAVARNVAFVGVRVPPSWSVGEARERFAECVDDPAQFRFEENTFVLQRVAGDGA